MLHLLPQANQVILLQRDVEKKAGGDRSGRPVSCHPPEDVRLYFVVEKPFVDYSSLRFIFFSSDIQLVFDAGKSRGIVSFDLPFRKRASSLSKLIFNSLYEV